MLKKIRSLTERYAIPSALIIFVLIKILWLVLGQLLAFMPQTPVTDYLREIILMIVPAGIVVFFGFSRAFRKGNFWRGIVCCLPFLLLQLLMLTIFFVTNLNDPETSWNPWYLIVYEVVGVIGIGFREECVYRATIQNIVAKKYANSVKGIWIAVLVGAFVFGPGHFTNLLFGESLPAVLAQVVSATVLGILFGAVYMRSGSIWALALIHTVTDISGLAQSTFLGSISDIEDLNLMAAGSTSPWGWLTVSWAVLRLCYIAIAIYLLRPSKCKQICESLCFADERAE